MKKIIVIIALILIAMPTAIGNVTSFNERETNRVVTTMFEDYDPLVDISVTVEINKIRSLEKLDVQIPSNKKINPIGFIFYNFLPFKDR
jgi:hypothetical protein